MANWTCMKCGFSNISERTTCKQCGAQQLSLASGGRTEALGQASPASAIGGSTSLSERATEEYKMVPIPRTFRAQESEVAAYMQQLANQHAAEGWHFYRIDEIGVVNSPSCIGVLLGNRETVVPYYVVTFKRPIQRGM